MAFSEGVTNKRLVGKLETNNMETVSELFALADKYALEAEAYARVKHRGAPRGASDARRPEARRQGEQVKSCHWPGRRGAPEATA